MKVSSPLTAGLVLGVMLIVATALAYTQHRFERGYVEIGDGLRVTVDVAASDITRERGLSGRSGLEADEGMYFLFPRADRFVFWMKEMRFPIDIIWIKDGVIVDISPDAPVPGPGQEPARFMPATAANRVLEVRAGFVKAHNVRVGQPVR